MLSIKEKPAIQKHTYATMSKSQKRFPHWNLALSDHLPLSGWAIRGFNHLKTLLPTATPTRQHSDRKPCRLWAMARQDQNLNLLDPGQLQMQQPKRERKQPGAVALQLERQHGLLWQLCPPPEVLKEDVAHCLWRSAISITLFPVRVKHPFPRSSQPTFCTTQNDNTGRVVEHHTLQRPG